MQTMFLSTMALIIIFALASKLKSHFLVREPPHYGNGHVGNEGGQDDLYTDVLL